MNEDAQKILTQITETKDYFQKAKLLENLIVKKGLTIKQISMVIAMKPSYICHVLRLNKLPELIVDGYYSQLITLSHLFVISRLRTHEEMERVYEKVLSESYTVLQTEELVRQTLHNVMTEGTRLDTDIVQKAASGLAEKFGQISLQVVQTRIKGKIVIELKGNQTKTTKELEELLGALGSRHQK